MTGHVEVAGAWKDLSAASVKINGAWETVKDGYVKVNGEWKQWLSSSGAYELIESNILTSSASSVTFSSIPQDYKHLQLRAVARLDGNISYGNTLLSLNGISPSYWHYLYTYNTSLYPGAYGSPYGNYSFFVTGSASQSEVGSFAPTVLDILDYSSTSKNKTIKYLTGYNSYISGIGMMSNLWNNTAAVTSISLTSTPGNYVAGSRFSLYGIRG